MSAASSFASTVWSCVQAAQNPADPNHIAAMNRLISMYWRPVFRCLRAKGFSTDDAEDLTQDFFLRFIVDRQPEQRRPTTRAVPRPHSHKQLDRLTIDRKYRANRQAKFERQYVTIHSLMTDSDRNYEPPAHQSHENVFEAQWKADLLATVQTNLRKHFVELANPEELRRFEVFAARNFIDRDEKQPTEEELAARFELTRDQIRYVLKLVGNRYKRLLTQEFREQVGPDDVETELSKLTE